MCVCVCVCVHKTPIIAAIQQVYHFVSLLSSLSDEAQYCNIQTERGREGELSAVVCTRGHTCWMETGTPLSPLTSRLPCSTEERSESPSQLTQLQGLTPFGRQRSLTHSMRKRASSGCSTNLPRWAWPCVCQWLPCVWDVSVFALTILANILLFPVPQYTNLSNTNLSHYLTIWT